MISLLAETAEHDLIVALIVLAILALVIFLIRGGWGPRA